jgi:hypothetical protein
MAVPAARQSEQPMIQIYITFFLNHFSNSSCHLNVYFILLYFMRLKRDDKFKIVDV